MQGVTHPWLPEARWRACGVCRAIASAGSDSRPWGAHRRLYAGCARIRRRGIYRAAQRHQQPPHRPPTRPRHHRLRSRLPRTHPDIPVPGGGVISHPGEVADYRAKQFVPPTGEDFEANLTPEQQQAYTSPPRRRDCNSSSNKSAKL